MEDDGKKSTWFADVIEEFDAKINNEAVDGSYSIDSYDSVSDYDDSDDWDTDLDDDEIIEICEQQDTTGIEHYTTSCSELGISPSRHVINSLRSAALSLRHKSCGSNEIKAVKKALISNTSVRRLDLEGNYIEYEGLHIVKNILKKNKNITELSLAENNLGSAASVIFGDILKTTVNLTHIDFRGNKLQDKDMVKLAEGIAANKSVRVLNLGHNEFRSFDKKVMKETLTHNSTIYELDLSWNHIRLEGAIALADGIAKNTSIEILKLAFNGFSDDGAAAMGRSLKLNNSLTTLDLTSNRISNKGAKALSKGIMNNKALRVLKIGYNPITAEGALALLLAMKHVTTLEELWMENVCLNVNAVEVAEAMIQERNGVLVVYGTITKSTSDNGLYKGINGERNLKWDILGVLKQYLSDNRLRMLDLFNQWDKDKSMRLTKKKFIIGVRTADIPLSTEMISYLIKKVQENTNEKGMSYREFVTMLTLND